MNKKHIYEEPIISKVELNPKQAILEVCQLAAAFYLSIGTKTVCLESDNFSRVLEYTQTPKGATRMWGPAGGQTDSSPS
ncbi:MAG: hypothetical protein PHQ52_07830 [Candidatus Omnitrophica bacterium]|nr:hypothetical protein [Candidatus Omnitrophota bacterium]